MVACSSGWSFGLTGATPCRAPGLGQTHPAPFSWLVALELLGCWNRPALGLCSCMESRGPRPRCSTSGARKVKANRKQTDTSVLQLRLQGPQCLLGRDTRGQQRGQLQRERQWDRGSTGMGAPWGGHLQGHQDGSVGLLTSRDPHLRCLWWRFPLCPSAFASTTCRGCSPHAAASAGCRVPSCRIGELSLSSAPRALLAPANAIPCIARAPAEPHGPGGTGTHSQGTGTARGCGGAAQPHCLVQEGTPQLLMDMSRDAFDDQYEGCAEAMEAAGPALLEQERARGKSRLFRRVWGRAGERWQWVKGALAPRLPPGFKDEYGQALIAYTDNDLHRVFNAAVRAAGRSWATYNASFPFKALHFYLTRALQLLRGPCEAAYGTAVFRGLARARYALRGASPFRFGSFASCSFSRERAESFGQDTFLSIRSCFGVPIHAFSLYTEEEE
ncbi:uncharacterized protein LOC110404905, partial [Numida meleagris]|uniref:uncharacterized protein LOC110404905 n=1 Tax=Numida meleagris TaxID=8996 RepID=UPI000B3E16DE